VPAYPTALGATWDAAWSSLGRPAPAGLQAELMAAWSELHRHYHDQWHLRECLALWARWRESSRRPGEVVIALWFHEGSAFAVSGYHSVARNLRRIRAAYRAPAVLLARHHVRKSRTLH
jgi:predicted metal-dependent HD superfamily phosphohydrolase